MRAQKSSHHSHSFILEDIKKEFTRFLQRAQANEQVGNRQSKYQTQIRRMIDAGKHLLTIQYQDLISFNNEFANLLFEEYYKYQPLLNQALTQFAREKEKQLRGVHEQHEQKRDQDKQQKYQVTFDNSINHSDQVSVRDLRCDKLGKLFSFRGTVTRTTEVRPQLVTGIFRCKGCSALSKPISQQFKYTEPKKCFTVNCDMKAWELDIGKSQFADFQKLRVQQDPTKIPPGAMPRSIDVILRNENTQKGQPGDICKFVGYLCVLPQIISMLKPGQKTTVSTRNLENRGQMMQLEGVRGIKGIRQLNYRLIFIATNVLVENNQFRQETQLEENEDYDLQQNQQIKQVYNQEAIQKIYSKLTQQQLHLIQQFKQNKNVYEDMAESLFPSIFGQTQIKKALLLQLFGGIHKKTKNKISIRGDINILIVGDPSTAKSQFLKAINKFVPRSVYTNGKTTSAAGLTASVSKDDTGCVGIQAGALMLADNGICCIDEFDKMNYSDQTAIHEAMEQQTISIAKAGVYATLNARTSILAAANPIFGRYDKSKSLKANLNISAPIMSRFDLFFVVCDEANDSADANLSQFIIKVHRFQQRAVEPKYTSKNIKFYISTAKKLKPMLSLAASQKLRLFYKQMRQRDKKLQNTSYAVTVRQLESMIRVSEALAKLYLDTQIKPQYVEEAYRLISTSIMKLQKSPININDYEQQQGINKLKNTQNLVQGDIALERQLQQKRQEKKNRQISISHELYQDIQKNILQLFKLREQKESLSQNQNVMSQQSIVNYLLGINFEAGMLQTQEQTKQMKKIANAVIKKLIREDRVLMVVQDKPQPGERLLRVHPNFSY